VDFKFFLYSSTKKNGTVGSPHILAKSLYVLPKDFAADYIVKDA